MRIGTENNQNKFSSEKLKLNRNQDFITAPVLFHKILFFKSFFQLFFKNQDYYYSPCQWSEALLKPQFLCSMIALSRSNWVRTKVWDRDQEDVRTDSQPRQTLISFYMISTSTIKLIGLKIDMTHEHPTLIYIHVSNFNSISRMVLYLNILFGSWKISCI